MVAQAERFLADADLLTSCTESRSDAEYLLRVLAFEILLKANLLAQDIAPPKTHGYRDLLGRLPGDIRERIVAAASSRMSSSADYSQLDRVLDRISKNFIALRYAYDSYGDMSPEDYKAAGAQWVEGGASESDATFVYHPEELEGLIHSLRSQILLDG